MATIFEFIVHEIELRVAFEGENKQKNAQF